MYAQREKVRVVPALEPRDLPHDPWDETSGREGTEEIALRGTTDGGGVWSAIPGAREGPARGSASKRSSAGGRSKDEGGGSRARSGPPR